MKLGVKIQLLSFCSQVFNFIFLALGLSLFFSAIWILFIPENLLAENPGVELRTTAAGLILIGSVVAVVSVVGCFSVVKENRLLLQVYLGFIFVLFLGMLYVTLLLFVSQSNIESDLTELLNSMIKEYNGTTERDKLMDNIQYKTCCGLNSSADWLKNSYIQSETMTDYLPCSCFNITRRGPVWCPVEKMNDYIVLGGCQENINDWLQGNIFTVVGIGVSLIVVQVVLFGLMVGLYCSIGKKAALKTMTLADSTHASLSQDLEEDPDGGEQNYSYIEHDDGYMDPR